MTTRPRNIGSRKRNGRLRLFRYMGYALLFVWQLPQHLLGWTLNVMVRMCGGTAWRIGHRLHVCRATKERSGSVSLGRFVMLSRGANRQTLRHEIGHSRQSVMLGPLYLLVIGIPSFCWAMGRTLGFWREKSYYWFYTERWADWLAGIRR